MKPLNILVPTDFSEPSKAALRAAAQWVGAFGGVITPAHAYEGTSDLDGFQLFGPQGSIAGDLPTLERAIRHQLDLWARQAVAAEALRDGVFVLGNPARSIARLAAGHDLVILCSHGRSGYSRLVLGSVTEKVVRLSPAPVLVVHGGGDLLPLDRVLVPTDLSENSAAAFPFAQTLAEATGAVIELLYVAVREGSGGAPSPAPEQRLREFALPRLRETAVPVETAVRLTEGSAHEGIYRYVQGSERRLIVMSTAGRTVLADHLLGSTPAELVREAQTPVLLVNPEPYASRKRAEAAAH